MSTFGNRLFKIIWDFVCRWLIEVKVKIAENDVFAFFEIAGIKKIGKLAEGKSVGELVLLVGWWAVEEFEVDVHMV